MLVWSHPYYHPLPPPHLLSNITHIAIIVMSSTNIFLTGATGNYESPKLKRMPPLNACMRPGYIGGSVLNRLLAHPNAGSFEITALVRNVEKAAKFKDIGVNAVVGSHSDLDKLERLSSEADYVFAIVRDTGFLSELQLTSWAG